MLHRVKCVSRQHESRQRTVNDGHNLADAQDGVGKQIVAACAPYHSATTS